MTLRVSETGRIPWGGLQELPQSLKMVIADLADANIDCLTDALHSNLIGDQAENTSSLHQILD